MDKRKESLSTLKVCRFCLTQDVPMTSLYDKRRKQKNTVNLPLKILSCVSVEVFPSDKMPSFICQRCKYFMNICYEFKHICRQADEAVLHFIQDNAPLKPISWPVSLNNAYRDSNEIGVMKTVVEDGTTVQVTHDMSDSEEEEGENLYNVKINDGTDEVSKTCVKVVASRDEEKDTSRKRKGSEERRWACDQCPCTYPLQQMLHLHKLRKHRQRTVKCDQCNDKFFSKYDLAIHQLRHSEHMPFQCVVCSKRFKRHILLRRHEKLVHADLARHVCSTCSAAFLSQDELERHKKKHKQEASRVHRCDLCNKGFQDRTSLQRHIQVVHEFVPKFSCDYCTQRFSSATKLARHIRSHVGGRPYPCKYCDKSFIKSHHYTRHVRVKHRDEDRGRVSGEQYRCEQCDEMFGNQDELIYHSAIHATQNLTCPLCQEKFHNVDAVTAHIKSHVNGVEFMCDFCELVFTNKEKLDTHLDRVHEEEIQNELNQENQDHSSNGAEDDEVDPEVDVEEDDDTMNVKEEDDHMVIEIKKADDFMLKKMPPALEEQQRSSHSEGSDMEAEYLDQSSVESMATVRPMTQVKASPKEAPVKLPPPTQRTIIKPPVQSKPIKEQGVIRKSEELKHRPAQQAQGSASEKQEKPAGSQVTKIENSNDKSLRLLEKELQDLKRTNSRSEMVRTPVHTPRPRGRPPLHSSTPKPKPIEEKKTQVVSKPPVLERRQVEKKIYTKENKEPKEINETKPKEEVSKSFKNGSSDKSGLDDGIRRSTRPSKIKDYAKMIRVNTQEGSDSDELDDDDEYQQSDKSTEMAGRTKARRNSVRAAKGAPAVAAAAPAPPSPAAPPRKRGRPRKEPLPQDLPPKIKKMEPEPEKEKTPVIDEKPSKVEQKSTPMKEKLKEEREKSTEPEDRLSSDLKDLKDDEEDSDEDKISRSPQDRSVTEPNLEIEKENKESKEKIVEKNAPIVMGQTKVSNEDPVASTPPDSKIVSPTGQSLKMVTMKSLPPGVKPLPLPLGRSIPSRELCEMQIGKKVVKVQKIVMTKAEVEAMAKKGLVEMKDGTMVLKQGIKLPTVDKPVSADAERESPTKSGVKAAPTRCDLGD